MRNETKYILKKFEADFLFKKISAKNLYPPRFIYSLYFDSKDLTNYTDSEEGTVPREKWRLRTYTSYPSDKKKIEEIFKNDLFIEQKKTFEKHREKRRIFIKNMSFEDILKKIKNLSNEDLIPNVFVSYFRKYYTLNNGVRVTYDTDIKFYKYKHKMIINEKKINQTILEEKKPINFSDNSIFNIIGDKHFRNSKYCEAIKSIFNYNL